MNVLTILSSPVYAAAAALGVGVVYFIYLVVSRLYFSPLSKFPGPKIAAATGWYEFYHDYWLDGRYIFEIERMHKKYGPIVRINPEELSIHDPSFYNEIYVTESKRRTDHYDRFIRGMDFEGAHILTADHDLHRRRRKPLEPFFTRQKISLMQSMLAEVTLHFESRLREFKGTGKVIRLDHALAAVTGDIIGRICLGNRKISDRFLDDADFAPGWYNMMHAIVRAVPLFVGFPFLVKILSYVPEKFILKIYPRGQMFNIFREEAKQQVQTAMLHDFDKDSSETSIFRHIVRSDMPMSELSVERLGKEAQTLLATGTVSTARTMGFASYYILSRPELRRRLESELKDVMAGWPEVVPSWAELERVLILQAIMKESLRLSYGVMHRLPRVSPDVPIQYKDYTIPPGVPVGMSAYLMHSDPNVYPEPDSFMPERWLKDVTPAMNRSYVPFTRGSRNCLGINLSMSEMSLILAVLYRPGGPGMELYKTDERDVKPIHDFMVPLPRLKSEGVRVIIQ